MERKNNSDSLWHRSHLHSSSGSRRTGERIAGQQERERETHRDTCRHCCTASCSLSAAANRRRAMQEAE